MRLAFLRDGRFAVVSAVLAELFVRGAVVAGRNGTVRHPERWSETPTGFERQVWNAIHGPVSPGALAARPSVDQALNGLRAALLAEGLVRRGMPSRSYLPSRTRAGRRLLEQARARTPLGTTTHEIGLQVALYDQEALIALVPFFAARSGLLARSSSDVARAADTQLPDNPTLWG